MIEPEIAFADLSDDATLAERLLKYVLRAVLEERADDMAFFEERIEKGLIVSHEGPPAFQEVLDQISSDERIMVREFGVGLNRAMGKDRLLKDITAFERQKGLHLSLGEKHGVYKKPGFNPKKTHYHIDVFVDVERIEIDGEELVY